MSYNDYERYGVLFDRTVPWQQKVGLLAKKQKRAGTDGEGESSDEPKKKR